MEKRTYTFSEEKLNKSYYISGFDIDKGCLKMTEEDYHIVILPVINSYSEGSTWGRFCFDNHISDNCIVVVYAIAIDADDSKRIRELNEHLSLNTVSLKDRLGIFNSTNAIKNVNHSDMLFYDLKGQYIYIGIEVIGRGEGYIEHVKLITPGDNFMQTFPEIYQEENSFFHRYMSIFSSLYSDLQHELDTVHDSLSLDKAPKELLTIYAGWLGLDIEGGFLEESVLRKLLSEIYELNGIKGTKKALQRLIELVIGETPVIIERNLLNESKDIKVHENYNMLYGSNLQDVTILVNKRPDEKQQAQLMYLIRQLKPIRSNVRLIYYTDCNSLDSYCFLDMNARLKGITTGRLNANNTLDGRVVLA